MSGTDESPMELLTAFRERQSALEIELWQRWKPAFDLYDAVLMEARQAAAYVIKHHRDEAAQNQDALFEVLTRLQARAYRTAWEIRALLVSGTSDGALARWRTLYEGLVVMRSIEKHGADTAHRYLEYDALQSAKTLKLFQQYREVLGHAPLVTGQAESIQQGSSELMRDWVVTGPADNAWAARQTGGGRPSRHTRLSVFPSAPTVSP